MFTITRCTRVTLCIDSICHCPTYIYTLRLYVRHTDVRVGCSMCNRKMVSGVGCRPFTNARLETENRKICGLVVAGLHDRTLFVRRRYSKRTDDARHGRDKWPDMRSALSHLKVRKVSTCSHFRKTVTVRTRYTNTSIRVTAYLHYADRLLPTSTYFMYVGTCTSIVA